MPTVNRPIFSNRHACLWFGLCAAIVLPRVYLAIHDQGVLWPDEIFQTLEQGHRLAFGYGFVPWEFQDAARSWFLPGVIGCVMKLLAAIGVTSGAGLAIGLKLLFAGLAIAAFYPMLRMAEAWGGIFALTLLGLVASVFPASLIYSSRAMSEVASGTFLAWGLWLLWPWGIGRAGKAAVYVAVPMIGSRSSSIRRLLVSGLLLGLATLLRYQNAILLPAILIIVTVRRSFRAAALVAAGIGVVMSLGGLLDWVTWGKPFQSLIVYVRFNLIEDGASQWGVAKQGFFLRAMLSTNGAAVWILVFGFFAGLRRTWPVALQVMLFFGVHSVIPHKELRFLYPVVPLFLLCAAVGLAMLVAKLPFPRRRQVAVTGALAFTLWVVFAVRAPGVSFADIGQPMDAAGSGGPTTNLVWRAYDERNHLYNQAGSHADICGLAAPSMNAYWTGGYIYLHRPVPILWSGSRTDFDAANYVLMSPGQTMDDDRYRVIAQDGAYVLYRREGTCTVPPRDSVDFGRLIPMGVTGP